MKMTVQSPLPFGVLRVHRQVIEDEARTTDAVSIAFRRSPRSPPRENVTGLDEDGLWSPLPFGVLRVHRTIFPVIFSWATLGLHCLSAFSAFTARMLRGLGCLRSGGLHCVSAFSAFTAGYSVGPPWRMVGVSIAFRRSPRSPQHTGSMQAWTKDPKSPLPF